MEADVVGEKLEGVKSSSEYSNIENSALPTKDERFLQINCF
jgi:hypothetical protein